jgi:DNA-binding NarL/FixJ family response regulator
MAASVLIVDDHPAFRRSARRLLESLGYDVVGEAASGRVAVRTARRLRPDIVLLDVHLPHYDGFEVAERLAAAPRPPRVVFVSSDDRSDLDHRLVGGADRPFISKVDLSSGSLDAALSGGP